MDDDTAQTRPSSPDPGSDDDRANDRDNDHGNEPHHTGDRDNAGNILPEKAVETHNSARPGGTGEFARATGRDLERGPDQPQYRRYQYDLIAPHVGASMLEVGAGIGDFAAQFDQLDRVVITDVDPDAVALIGERFADRDEVEAQVLDLSRPVRPDALGGRRVETVVAINVLEHVEDHVGTLAGLATLVTPGGTVVMWVPGYMALYGEFDARVGHVRRYTPQTLTAAFRDAGLVPELVRPVNVLGGLAWWLVVRKGGTGAPNPKLVAVYNRVVVPLTRIVDKLGIGFGQSILGVARVPSGPGS